MDDVHETGKAAVQHEEQVGLVDALELTDTYTINRTGNSRQRFYTILVQLVLGPNLLKTSSHNAVSLYPIIIVKCILREFNAFIDPVDR